MAAVYLRLRGRAHNIRRNRVFRDRDNPLDYLDDKDVAFKNKINYYALGCIDRRQVCQGLLQKRGRHCIHSPFLTYVIHSPPMVCLISGIYLSTNSVPHFFLCAVGGDI